MAEIAVREGGGAGRGVGVGGGGAGASAEELRLSRASRAACNRVGAV